MDVAHCRVLLESDSEELNRVFDPVAAFALNDSNTYAKKLQLVKSGTLQLALDIVKRGSPHHQEAVRDVWTMVQYLVIPANIDDENEAKLILEFVNMGGVELTSQEFERRFHRSGDKSMLLTFAWLATVDEATPHIVQCGIHKYAIDTMKNPRGENPGVYDTALSFMRTACACYSVREKLRQDGALSAAIPLLQNLTRPLDDKLSLRTGFRAGSIIARLAGNDEQGEGVQLLRGNPLLIERTLYILDQVLDAGAEGTFLGMAINPHFITMDLLTIATSDVNKPLLKSAIPVLIKALRLRGKTNVKMVVDILNIFLQLTYDKEGLKVLHDQAAEVIQLFQDAMDTNATKYERDAQILLMNLKHVLQPPVVVEELEQSRQVAPAKGGGGLRLGGLLKRAMKEKAAQAGAGEERRKSFVAAAQNDRHIMLSYNWGVKAVVLLVDSLLRANGVKTWLDDRDMGANLNDSMANAIENAAMVFVFMTAKYKESANCRKECEYADSNNVPITFIMAQENYKPNGWLGIQLGKAIWVPCWTPELAEASLPQLLDRAKPGSGAKVKTMNNPNVFLPPTSATATTSSSSETNNDSEVVTLLKAIQEQVGSLQRELTQMKDQMTTLSASVADLKGAVGNGSRQ